MTARPRLWTALVAMLATLAGCVGAGTPDDPDPSEPAAQPGAAVEPIEGDPLPPTAGHDHMDPAQHAVERNIELVSYPTTDPLSTTYKELDVQGDWLAQCTTGFVRLWNVTDPAAPVLASELDVGGSCPDVKMTDDAQYLVASGTQLWDIRDKDEPRKVAENEETSCHMCSIHAIGGKEYLFSAHNGQGMAISLLTREPPAIEKVSEWGYGTSCDPRRGDPMPWIEAGRAPDPDCLIVGQFHDVYVYDDPLLGKPVAVPAYWDLGMYFVDVSDPANPVEIGRWADYQGESGDIHTTAVDFLEVEGETRRIAVAATETGPVIGPFSTAEPSSVYVFDATDLSNIELLARWVNPGKRPSGAQGSDLASRETPVVGEFSTHNLQFEQGNIYLAYYHAGVWVLDVQAWLDAGGAVSATSHVLGDEVPVLGVFNTRGMDGERGLSMVWDVVLKDGYLYASDTTFGLFVLHFLGDPAGDPAYTSDA